MSQSTGTTEQSRADCALSFGVVKWRAHAGGSPWVSTCRIGKVATIGYHGRPVALSAQQYDRPLDATRQGDLPGLAVRRDPALQAGVRRLSPELLNDPPRRHHAGYLPRVSQFSLPAREGDESNWPQRSATNPESGRGLTEIGGVPFSCGGESICTTGNLLPGSGT